MRRGMTLIAVVLVGGLFVGGSLIVRRGWAIASEMLIEPSRTEQLARETIKTIGPDWSLSEATIGSADYHRYIFTHDGHRRDVNVSRDTSGAWSAKVTPPIY